MVGTMGPPFRHWGPANALHLKGELRMGPTVRLWCLCGWRWEGPTRESDAAWESHMAEAGTPQFAPSL